MPEAKTSSRSLPERARGLVSSPASGRRIDAHRQPAPDDLDDMVECLWVGRWDLPPDAPHETELLSDPCVHVAFERGGPHAGARVVGVWSRRWHRRLEGRGLVRAAKLRAGAVRAWFDVPAHTLENRIVPLVGFFAETTEPWLGKILDPPDDATGLDALARWLRAMRRQEPAPQVRDAVALAARIATDPRLTSVEALASAVGRHPRALQRLFRDFVGVSPKFVIRRHRLQEVARRLERGDDPRATLADLAADLGYTDQAHLARDFRAAVGKSPSAFAAFVRRS